MSRSRGFTLIELLVALVILGLIATASYRGLTLVLESRNQVVNETRKWQAISGFWGQLAQDISLISPIQSSAAPGQGLPPVVGLGYPNDSIDGIDFSFVRAGMGGQGIIAAAPHRVGYRLDAHTIYLLRWPSLHGLPQEKPRVYPMLREVANWQLRFLDQNRIWQTSWPAPGVNGLPNAVEVTVTMLDGQKFSRIFARQ